MVRNLRSVLLSSCLRTFPCKRSISSLPEKTLVHARNHGEWKKHLFICFPLAGIRDESPDFSCLRYVSVENLIQPPPSDEPFLSQDDAEVEILRARQSWRRRFEVGCIPEYEVERVEDIMWRGFGYSVFLSHKETTPLPPTEIFKMLQDPSWTPHEVPYHSLSREMAFINVEQKLYFLGGEGEEEFSKEVHCYDLLKEGGGYFRCADMLQPGSGCRLGDTRPPLVVHIDGKLYVLCYSTKKSSVDDDIEEALDRAYRLYKEAEEDSKEAEDAWHKFQEAERVAKLVPRTFCTYCFQEYDIAKNEWTLLPLFDGAENFDFPLELNDSSHVVIGKKLCISLGKSSFTFDTVNRVWEDCMLFGSNKRMHEEESVVIGGLPFNELYSRSFKGSQGFRGRGIMWDGDILLGIGCHEFPVVAFLLVDGKVVNQKRFTFNSSTDGMYHMHPMYIVDLGGGYFSLLHNVRNLGDVRYIGGVYDYPIYDHSEYYNGYSSALVTFKVSRVEKQQNNDDEFITCQGVEPKALLVRNDWECAYSLLHAFCV